MRIKNCLNP